MLFSHDPLLQAQKPNFIPTAFGNWVCNGDRETAIYRRRANHSVLNILYKSKSLACMLVFKFKPRRVRLRSLSLLLCFHPSFVQLILNRAAQETGINPRECRYEDEVPIHSRSRSHTHLHTHSNIMDISDMPISLQCISKGWRRNFK